MKYLGYTWKVLINLISVFVILALFLVASTSFESVVISSLVLIYLSINSFTALWALHNLEFGEALNQEIQSIKKMILGKHKLDVPHLSDLMAAKDILSPNPELSESEQIEKEIKLEREENKKVIMVKFYINLGFQFLIYIIALFNLFSAL